MRVLFVDDEEMVLRGLRNVLRRRRNEWDMVFACGAEAALAEVAKAPFDVIVSDMRMPGMSGVELLERVKESAPDIVRIILSGHSENAAMAKAFVVAHQFLSKPCDGATLERTLERAARQRELVTDARMRKIVGALSSVPILGGAYARLTAVLADPRLDVATVARLIETSPSMSAKVLQIASSDYVGAKSTSSSVEDALCVLGIDFARGLLLSSSMFDVMRTDANREAIERIEAACTEAARLGRTMTPDRDVARETSWAGLFQEVGWLVLQHAFPHDPALHGARSCAAERAAFGACHAEIGAYLLGMWGLPLGVVDAVHAHAGDAPPSSEPARHLLEAKRLLRAQGKDVGCNDVPAA